MDAVTIKIAGKQNLSFFIKLIEKLSFVKGFSVASGISLENNRTDLPVDWAKDKPNIDDFAGVWSDNPITIEEIRAKGWKRN